MTKAQLIAALSSLPDDAQIVIETFPGDLKVYSIEHVHSTPAALNDPAIGVIKIKFRTKT